MDLSTVVRPRTTPLASAFHDAEGRRRELWTTFSADQVDLDYRTPEVLLEIARVLLYYVARGAQLLRLDAVTYLWKESGTSCASLPQTHAVLKVLRAVLELAAPWVVVLTETNVPHRENIGYFGDGHDEAQMVYNFALPPLVLHSVLSGDAAALRSWAAGLTTPSDATCFFNFLASHDGIGLRAVEGILDDAAVDAMVEATLAAREAACRAAPPRTANAPTSSTSTSSTSSRPRRKRSTPACGASPPHTPSCSRSPACPRYTPTACSDRAGPPARSRAPVGRAASTARSSIWTGSSPSSTTDGGAAPVCWRPYAGCSRSGVATRPSRPRPVRRSCRPRAASSACAARRRAAACGACTTSPTTPSRCRRAPGPGAAGISSPAVALEPSDELTLEPLQTLWLESR